MSQLSGYSVENELAGEEGIRNGQSIVFEQLQ